MADLMQRQLYTGLSAAIDIDLGSSVSSPSAVAMHRQRLSRPKNRLYFRADPSFLKNDCTRLGEMSESRETKGGTLNSFHLVHRSAGTITIG